MATLWERLAGLDMQNPTHEGKIDITDALYAARMNKAGLTARAEFTAMMNMTPEQTTEWETDFLDHIPEGILGYAWIEWLGHVLRAAQDGLPTLDTENKVRAAMGVPPRAE